MSDLTKQVPESLHHYTSIGALAMILKSRRFRFSRLDKLDDLLEGQSADIENFGKYCFVSSWTAQMKESLPFWNMYTPEMRGVRISMPASPFKTYGYGKDMIYTSSDKLDISQMSNRCPIDFKLYGKFCNRLHYVPEEFLVPVEYEELEKFQKPEYFIDTGNGIGLKIGHIGKVKVDSWKFQDEFRYRLIIMPSSFYFQINEIEPAKRIEKMRDIARVEIVEHHELFCDIRDDAMARMEIVIGPKCSDSEAIIVEALCAKYNPEAKIRSSELTHVVRKSP